MIFILQSWSRGAINFIAVLAATGDRLPLDKSRLRCLACKETMEAAELFEAEEHLAQQWLIAGSLLRYFPLPHGHSLGI